MRVFNGRKIAISRIVNDHIQRAKYIDRRHYRVCCCCFVGHIHCEELDLISISFRQISQRLNVPSCRQHFVARSEARFNNCMTQTTRAASDYPYLRHSSSPIKPPPPQIFWRSLSNSGLDARFCRSCTPERGRTSSSEIPRSDVYLRDQSVRVWDQLARSNAERRRMAISKDTTAEQGGKKVVHKIERWIRLSANDRPEPTRS